VVRKFILIGGARHDTSATLVAKEFVGSGG
jgi:hypothetical protein